MSFTIGVGIIGISAYFILQLIGSLLHDMKYVFFLNGKNILKAIIVADIYAIFNNHIIKAIASTDILVTDIITLITISISIWFAMTYSNKHVKEYVYEYEIVTKYLRTRFELKDKFKELNIPYQYSTYWYENDKGDDQSETIQKNEFGESLYHKYIIKAYTKKHSKQLDELIKSFGKYVKTNKKNTSQLVEDKKNENEEQ